MDRKSGMEEEKEQSRWRQIPRKLYAESTTFILCKTPVAVYQMKRDPPQWTRDMQHGTLVVIASQDTIKLHVSDSRDHAYAFHITDNSDYKIEKEYFHSFVCVDNSNSESRYGLRFEDRKVGKEMGALILQLITHACELDISSPRQSEVCAETTPPPTERKCRKRPAPSRPEETPTCSKKARSEPYCTEHVCHGEHAHNIPLLDGQVNIYTMQGDSATAEEMCKAVNLFGSPSKTASLPASCDPPVQRKKTKRKRKNWTPKRKNRRHRTPAIYMRSISDIFKRKVAKKVKKLYQRCLQFMNEEGVDAPLFGPIQ